MKIKSSGIYVKAKGTEISNFQTKGSLLFFSVKKKESYWEISKAAKNVSPP